MQKSFKGFGLLLAICAAAMIWTQLPASPQTNPAQSPDGTMPLVASAPKADASNAPQRTPDHLGTHLEESTTDAIDP
jgi:hypothetical protein